MNKNLTIGMACYDDFNGVFFSVMQVKANLSPEQLKRIDFVVVDNNPTSAEGQHTKAFCEKTSATYVPYTEKKSTSIRNKVFDYAKGDWVVCIDCHVVIPKTSIEFILDFINTNDSDDLYHGVLMAEWMGPIATHLHPQWRDRFYGTWQVDQVALEAGVPFEIPSHGLGMFMCKKTAWLGFSQHFTGFGGEEGYIHSKYRKMGRTCWCMPQILWYHRFERPAGIPYRNDHNDRVFNYFVGKVELDEPCADVYEAFKGVLPDVQLFKLHANALKQVNASKSKVK